MSHYYKSYNEFCHIVMDMQIHTIKNHIEHYPIIEDLLGFHCWLFNEMSSIYNQPTDYDANHLHEVFTDATFSHNLLSLFTTFLTIERNLFHQARANMRTVLESIPKIFYLSFYPNEIDYMIIHDLISGIRNDKEKIEKIKEFKSHTNFPPFKNINPDEIIEKCKNRYNFKCLVKKIYTTKNVQVINNLYSSMSTSTHSSFIKSYRPYDKKSHDKTLRDLELLLFYNLIATISGHKDMIEAGLFPFNESKAFMEKMRSILTQDGRLPFLFPDHPDIASRVNIHPPGPPWE